jgi:hypothetical protein
LIVGKYSCGRISRIRVRQTVNRRACPLPDGIRALGIATLQFLQSMPQASRIQLADGENAETALRASGTTCNPGTGSLRSIRQSRIYDLDQHLVARR